jgi:hypothetical protein
MSARDRCVVGPSHKARSSWTSIRPNPHRLAMLWVSWRVATEARLRPASTEFIISFECLRWSRTYKATQVNKPPRASRFAYVDGH